MSEMVHDLDLVEEAPHRHYILRDGKYVYVVGDLDRFNKIKSTSLEYKRIESADIVIRRFDNKVVKIRYC